jgi:hypothetical protein
LTAQAAETCPELEHSSQSVGVVPFDEEKSPLVNSGLLLGSFICTLVK